MRILLTLKPQSSFNETRFRDGGPQMRGHECGCAAKADLNPITIGRPVVGALRTHTGSSQVDALKSLFAAKTLLLFAAAMPPE